MHGKTLCSIVAARPRTPAPCDMGVSSKQACVATSGGPGLKPGRGECMGIPIAERQVGPRLHLQHSDRVSVSPCVEQNALPENRASRDKCLVAWRRRDMF